MTTQMYQMTSEIQMYSSKETSINSTKLPVIFKKVNWSVLPLNFTVLDYGAGKYLNHIADFIHEKGGIYYGYDKYNQTPEHNENCLSCNPDIIICSNVLNVIKENEILRHVMRVMSSYNKPIFIKIYEGDKSGVGKETKPNCWQRNLPKECYVVNSNYKIKHGIITTAPDLVV